MVVLGNSDTESDHSDESGPVHLMFDGLDEILNKAENYTPTIPDGTMLRIFEESGIPEVDNCVLRIISLAIQLKLSDIANDALQNCKTRTSSQHTSSHGATKDRKPKGDRKYTMAMEDLTPALADHGIISRKPSYFV